MTSQYYFHPERAARQKATFKMAQIKYGLSGKSIKSKIMRKRNRNLLNRKEKFPIGLNIHRFQEKKERHALGMNWGLIPCSNFILMGPSKLKSSYFGAG